VVDVLLGVAIVAAVHVAGALINTRISSRSDAREMWAWLGISWFWWALGPYALIQDERRRRRLRRAGAKRWTPDKEGDGRG